MEIIGNRRKIILPICKKIIRQKVITEKVQISSLEVMFKKLITLLKCSFDNALSISVNIAIKGKSEAIEKNSVNDTNKDSNRTKNI